MSVEEGEQREALGLFVFLAPKPKELQLFCSELIGDLTGDMQWEPSCPSHLTETTGHCAQTQTTQLAPKRLPAFNHKYLEETPLSPAAAWQGSTLDKLNCTLTYSNFLTKRTTPRS